MTLHAPLPRRSGIYGIISPSGNMYGRKHSEETKAKIGAKHRGKFVSAETRAKLSNKTITPEMRTRMRDAALKRHQRDREVSP